jgi:hypothetical protein
VEEAAFLMAVQGIVGRIEVEHDLGGSLRMGVEEQFNEQRLDGCRVVPDLVIAPRPAAQRLLQAIERRLAGQRRAFLAAGRELADQHRHDPIRAQHVVIDQILVAECQPEHALADVRLDRVLDQVSIAGVGETSRETRTEANRLVGRAEKQRTPVRGDLATIESAHNRTPLDGSEIERILATVCRHRAPPISR